MAEDPVRRVLAGSAWLITAYVVAFGFAFVQSIVLARRLGAELFGTLAIVIAVVTFVQMLVGFRVWEAVTTFVTEFRSRGDDVRAAATLKLCLAFDAGASALAILALWVAAQPLAQAFGTSAAADDVRRYAVGLVFAIPVATLTALLRVAGRYRWLAGHAAAENAIRLAAVVLVLTFTAGTLTEVIFAYLIAAAVSSLALVALGRSVLREMALPGVWTVRIGSLKEDRRRVTSLLFYSNLSASARLVTGRLDVLLVGWLTDPATVGVYRLARTVADPLAALATPVSHAVFPEVARLVHAHDAGGLRRLVSRIRSLAVAVALPACIATVALAGWAVPLLFGPEFEDAVPLIRIMAWQLVWLPFIWVPGLLLSLGRARAVATITVLDAVVYTMLLIVLVPSYGATGAAWATVVRFAAWTAMAAPIGIRAERRMELRWA